MCHDVRSREPGGTRDAGGLTMTPTHVDLKSELDKSTALLRTLRDEVRVQLHLGRLDAAEEWSKMEPRLEAALERAARDVSETSRIAVSELLEAVRKLRKTDK